MASVVLSILPLVTVSALALLVPSSVMMMSRRSGRHSAVTPGGERWVLLALAAGGILSGIAGAVLAVPLTAVGWSLIQIWFPDPRTPDASSTEGAPPDALPLDPSGPATPTGS